MSVPHIPDHYWKNLLAITTKAQAESGGTPVPIGETPKHLDAETRKWLESALSDFVSKSDPSKQLARILQILHSFAASTSSWKEDEEGYLLDLSEQLDDLIAVADFTSQFVNSGGLLILKSLIGQKNHDEVRASFARTILTLSENNEPAQKVLVEEGFLEFLMDILEDKSEPEKLRLSILSAISGIVRSNPSTFTSFSSLNGPKKLLSLTKDSQKVAAKAGRVLTSISYTLQDYEIHAKVLFDSIAEAYINLVEFGVEFDELEYIREFLAQFVEWSDLNELRKSQLVTSLEIESRRILNEANERQVDQLRKKFASLRTG